MVDPGGAAEVDAVRFGDCEVDLRALEVRRAGEVQAVEPQMTCSAC